jgi:small subunit ribosomal protein S16
MLRIRLRRIGKKKRPTYRVVVADQRAPRDGAFLETLGAYDPHTNPPSIKLNEERARDWMGKGAQPSEAAEKILRRAGVIEGPAPQRVMEPSKAEQATEAATAEAALEPSTEAEAEPPAEAAEAEAEQAEESES